MHDVLKHIIAVVILFMSGALVAEEQSVVLSVPGMKCPACPITVRVAIKRVKGVNSVSMNFDSNLAEVSYDDQLTNISNLQEAAKNVGFASQVIKDE
jgi:mercuric ion binding protein